MEFLCVFFLSSEDVNAPEDSVLQFDSEYDEVMCNCTYYTDLTRIDVEESREVVIGELWREVIGLINA